MGTTNAAYTAIWQLCPTLSKNERAYQSDKVLWEEMNVLISLSQPLLSHYRNRWSVIRISGPGSVSTQIPGKQPSCCFPWV